MEANESVSRDTMDMGASANGATLGTTGAGDEVAVGVGSRLARILLTAADVAMAGDEDVEASVCVVADFAASGCAVVAAAVLVAAADEVGDGVARLCAVETSTAESDAGTGVIVMSAAAGTAGTPAAGSGAAEDEDARYA